MTCSCDRNETSARNTGGARSREARGPRRPVLTGSRLPWPPQGPDSHYGTKGLRKVIHESPTTGAKTCFTFCYAAGNNNGTSVEDGQIPEIIFYT